jgi:hypothetical protein
LVRSLIIHIIRGVSGVIITAGENVLGFILGNGARGARGALVGLLVRIVTGASDTGDWVGGLVGAITGAAGAFVGATTGGFVCFGQSVGWAVRIPSGARVGALTGDPVGAITGGFVVGTCTGYLVGWAVRIFSGVGVIGVFVGAVTGGFVGGEMGAATGDLVGAMTGEFVGGIGPDPQGPGRESRYCWHQERTDNRPEK